MIKKERADQPSTEGNKHLIYLTRLSTFVSYYSIYVFNLIK